MRARIRVLELLVSTRLGGGPKHVFDAVTRLPRDEFSVQVAAPADGPYFERFRKAGIETHELALDRIAPAVLPRLRALARRSGAQLVHSHGKGAGLYGRLCARLLGLPAVHTFHGLHHGAYRAPARLAYLALERGLSRLTRTVISVSPAQEAEALALRLFRPAQSEVIVNGIDLAEIDGLVASHGVPRSAQGLGPEDFVVGCVARFDPVKSLDVLFAALGRLRVPRLRAVLVGEGREGERLRGLARAPGLTGVVTFAGAVEDAVRLFPAWDLYVSASRTEGLPISVLEAMACRRPVVATDIAAHRFVIADGASGVLVPPGRADLLAEAIAGLSAAPARRHALGEAARARVGAEFPLDRTVSRLAAVYRRAVDA
jgi:glycosyltransferase involved in cell wall biosynthesis